MNGTSHIQVALIEGVLVRGFNISVGLKQTHDGDKLYFMGVFSVYEICLLHL